MDIDKKEIIKNICYTDQVYGRINKKLNLNLNKSEIEEFISGLLIASTALTMNSILITNNEKHFNRIKGLKIENWIITPG